MEGINKEFILNCLAKTDRLSDDTWGDINDRHQIEWSDDHTRKISYGMKMYRDYMGINDTEEFVKLKKEKVKLQDIRTETNRQIRNLARIESIVDLIKDNINELAYKSPMINELHIKETPSGNDGLLLFGDWHYGMTTDNAINKYDVDICINRISDIVDKAIDVGERHNIDKLHILCLGDLISGMLHSEIRRNNQEKLGEQIINVSELLSQCIHKLSKHFYCTVSVVEGNHCAMDISKEERNNKDNYTMIIKEFLKLRLAKNDNVVILNNTLNDDEICVLDVKGFTVCGCHGDKINDKNVKSQLEMVTKTNLDVICYGHVHQSKHYQLYDTDVFVNSSLISTDAYAMDKKLFNPYSQSMLIIGEDGVQCNYALR